RMTNAHLKVLHFDLESSHRVGVMVVRILKIKRCCPTDSTVVDDMASVSLRYNKTKMLYED
ncbi:hypothetical protein, partial [Bacteroides acidifaciens]|uniref:hypothetical protein n=1 Tax=Bacteroides acidifaciens TaxID=85831 RepID=UPI00257889F2